MPTLPVRDLGGVGVVTDSLPFENPINAFSEARNVVFADGTIQRAPVFKKVDQGQTFTGTPVGILDTSEAEDVGHLVVVNSAGKIEELYNGSITDMTPSGGLTGSDRQITSTSLTGVDYICMESDVPVYKDRSMATFEPLPGWATDDRVKSIRAFGDFILALSVQKGATEYPTMVKWSDAVQAGTAPANWSTTDDASLAGENTLNMDGDLLDGHPLGSSFFLYGTEEVWRMQQTGNDFVFRFDAVFNGFKTMAKNCVASDGQVHFVFAQDDIYVHDGVSKDSLTHGTIHDYLFSRIDMGRSNRCFVFHDVYSQQIMFCYPSKSDEAAVSYDQVDGCNEAAVYNYKFKTWSFVDLPSVRGAIFGTTSKSTTWNSSGSWTDLESSWLSVEGRSPTIPIWVSTGALGVSPGVFFRDRLASGLIDRPVEKTFDWGGYALSVYKDFDDIGAKAFATKSIRSIYPNVNLPKEGDDIVFYFGSSNHYQEAVRWGYRSPFSPYDHYKIDSRVNGRLLSFRVEFPKGVHGELSGFDLDVVQTARR